MEEYRSKHIGSGRAGSLIVYGTGHTVSVDGTSYAAQWCSEHGMKPDYTTTDDAGRRYTVWTGTKRDDFGRPYNLGCAIPEGVTV